MIFKPELVEKILAGEKTVTRRPVKTAAGIKRATMDTPLDLLMPCRYEAGKTYAVQPGRGKKAVARIRILGVRRVRLGAISSTDAIREGFGGRLGFITYWARLYGTFDPDQLVDRIEFELVRSA